MTYHGLSWLVMAHGNSPKARNATAAETAPDLQRSTRVRGCAVLVVDTYPTVLSGSNHVRPMGGHRVPTEHQVGGVLMWMRTELSEGNARALREQLKQYRSPPVQSSNKQRRM